MFKAGAALRLMEFVEGASRLKGNAKALDIWRIETKLEARNTVRHSSGSSKFSVASKVPALEFAPSEKRFDLAFGAW